MATLAEHLQRAQQLNSNALTVELFNVVRKLEETFVDRNKEQLFEYRTDIFKNAIGYYSAATESISGGEKKAGDPFDLYDHGDFYRGFYLKIENDVISIDSTDSKTEMLKNAYKDEFKTFLSGEIFGLTDENLREVIERSILPLFISTQREILDI